MKNDTDKELTELISEVSSIKRVIGAHLVDGERLPKDKAAQLTGRLKLVGERLCRLKLVNPSDETKAWAKRVIREAKENQFKLDHNIE